MTHSTKIFLARWARRLSWNEVATVFETSWGCVFRAVKMVVDYGVAHRSLPKLRRNDRFIRATPSMAWEAT